ncbi:hypothetical protein BGX31_004791 [Mortierella sp. GBA43]|nr:hypothetical protein BGX31_004791 [Mortierella sp. GBA43]
MNSTDQSLTPGHFKAALRIVRSTLEQRISHDAQTSLANDILCVAAGIRFSQLDLLRIGQDHVFIIHRELLLEDIHDYLRRSSKGLQRVFVNVDCRLSQPEVMPKNRYRALDNYIMVEMLPEIQDRIECWSQAERTSRSLPAPSNVSMVTLTGWLLGYPVVYVLPLGGTEQKRLARLALEAAQRKRFQEKPQWSFPGQYIEDKDRPNEVYGHDDEDEDEDVDESEDEETGYGRNCLANQSLVVTKVHLEPSKKVEGLRGHCLLSFSYPLELAERWMDRSKESPDSPCTPLVSSPVETQRDEEHDLYDDGDDEFVDASDLDAMESERDSSPTSVRIPDHGASSFSSPPVTPSTLPSLSSRSGKNGKGLHLSSHAQSSCISDRERVSPFNNPDIHAAGRSFLHLLHTRFQNQTIWKTWQVGQQSETPPAVVMKV